MIEPAQLLQHFSIVGNMLCRRLLNGTFRPVTTIDNGRLVAVLDGHKLIGAEVAWLIHHLAPCPYPVIALDDPADCSVDNLMPVRRRRLRYRLRCTAKGYFHPLSKDPWSTKSAARQSWLALARAYYLADYKFVVSQITVEQVRQISEATLAHREPRLAKRFKEPRQRVSRPQRPAPPEGFDVHWFRDQWVTVPQPVHPSDDWMVRAEICLQNPDARFRYDPVQECTVQV